MKKLSTFWYSFKRSLTDPEYYGDILKAPFSFSLKYLFILLFLILLIRGIVLAISMSVLLPKVPQFVGQAKVVVRDFFPKELTVTLNNGTLRTNVDEPYTIPFPKQMGINDMTFAVIDTKSSVESYKNYKTLLFVTRNAIAYPDNNTSGGYKVYPLSDVKGYAVINRQVYQHLVDKVLPYLDYAPQVLIGFALAMLILLPTIGSVFYLSSVLFSLLLLTLVTYVISRLLKKPISYQSLYRLGMHGVTFSLLFDMLKSFFGISIPFTFSMSFFIWMLIVLNSLKTYGNPTASQPA